MYLSTFAQKEIDPSLFKLERSIFCERGNKNEKVKVKVAVGRDTEIRTLITH